MRDFVAGTVILLLAVAFLLSASTIESSEAGLVGPRFVPMVVASVAMGLGALLALAGILRGRKAAGAEAGAGDAEDPRLIRNLPLVAVPLCLGFLFVYLFPRIGFGASVLTFLILTLATFGERRPLRLALFGVFGAVGFHLVFKEAMGVFMPVGRWFDIAAAMGM